MFFTGVYGPRSLGKRKPSRAWGSGELRGHALQRPDVESFRDRGAHPGSQLHGRRTGQSAPGCRIRPGRLRVGQHDLRLNAYRVRTKERFRLSSPELVLVEGTDEGAAQPSQSLDLGERTQSILTDAFSGQPDLEVVGTAPDL